MGFVHAREPDRRGLRERAPELIDCDALLHGDAGHARQRVGAGDLLRLPCGDTLGVPTCCGAGDTAAVPTGNL